MMSLQPIQAAIITPNKATFFVVVAARITMPPETAGYQINYGSMFVTQKLATQLDVITSIT